MKTYELSNHLGNVLATVSDARQISNSGSSVTGYVALVKSATDYSAFGAPMAGRTYSSGSYRYGMNGQEMDIELGNGIYTAEFWEYDSRLARRWNTDPVVKHDESSYCTFSDSPILINDIHGDTGGNAASQAPEEETGNNTSESTSNGGTTSGVSTDPATGSTVQTTQDVQTSTDVQDPVKDNDPATWNITINGYGLDPNKSDYNADFAKYLPEDFKAYLIEKIPDCNCGVVDAQELFNGFVGNVHDQTPAHNSSDPQNGQDIINSRPEEGSKKEGAPVYYEMTLYSQAGFEIDSKSNNIPEPYPNDPRPEAGAMMEFTIQLGNSGYEIKGKIRVQEILNY